jgi:hypothetical protein
LRPVPAIVLPWPLETWFIVTLRKPGRALGRYERQALDGGTGMGRLKLLLLAFALAVPLAGCVVYQGPPPRAGAVWVPGHYGPYGGWVRGHWT